LCKVLPERRQAMAGTLVVGGEWNVANYRNALCVGVKVEVPWRTG
jgi:hypothetical protein